MGVRNYLIEGVSGSGKTAVATELQRLGHHVIHGDRELAYQGDPATGERIENVSSFPNVAFTHEHHIWDVAKVKAFAADVRHPVTFFCGGSRNVNDFIALFDGVFVLDIDGETLNARLAERSEDEFGGKPEERDFVLQLHATNEGLPGNAVLIDATRSVVMVVQAILRQCN